MELSFDRTRLVRGRVGTFVKYCGASAVSVPLGQSLLLLFYAGFGVGAVAANVGSFVLVTPIAYLLNRHWVWGKRTRSSLTMEVIPFIAMAVLALVASTLAVAVVERRWDHAVVISATSVAAYGMVWLARFFVLDTWLFRVEPAHEPVEPVAVA